ncbi:transglycosylase SLT domain-containing protein [Solihabitans fulvus]|uniref:Transglycosylase SLT domain-containing protein n=1 Tax=Solihabitans fulvus TaxID=1892852 RepID=A0A5B2XEG5_9PSEU|nr:transglycosylase SLT domain-containing protein [Solihabitans fulvus]
MTGCSPSPTGQGAAPASGSASSATSPAPAPSASAPSQGSPAPSADYRPERFADQVATHAASAGVDPQLLMAILYNESYKPHDPAFERAWQKSKPDSAFGIANMHKAAFDEAKRGRPFAGRDWQELPDDPNLAVQAAAWHLHDLAAQLPGTWPASYTKDEMLAFGYNAGAGNMILFAQGTKPGTQAQSYVDTLRSNWDKAGQTMKHSR